jgi:hypothetical protein
MKAETINIAALARDAGLPATGPAIEAFAKEVATECARIAAQAQPEGQLRWLAAHHSTAVGEDVAGRILAAFAVEYAPAAYSDPHLPAKWLTRATMLTVALDPRLAADDCDGPLIEQWKRRFAARLHELDPSREEADCARVARSLIDGEEGGDWPGWNEPANAAGLWLAQQRGDSSGRSGSPLKRAGQR